MQLHFSFQNKSYQANLLSPIDISVSTGPDGDNPNAFYINPAVFEPIRVGDFVGSVAMGGSTNCEILTLCAHGNGTHTESVGHITEERLPIPNVLNKFWFVSQLVTVTPDKIGCVDLLQIQQLVIHEGIEAIVFRSLPNDMDKKSRIWSGNNAPYFEPEALAYLAGLGIQHLLTDFPSVDPEVDEGRLSAHHCWWGQPQRKEHGNVHRVSPEDSRFGCTITEMIYVENGIADGLYALNLQVPHLLTDAVPSRPILYSLV